jgi:ketosteroid isomerase-like protein
VIRNSLDLEGGLMSNGNLELLKGAYDAFGRGDIPTVLGVMDENIEWNVPAAVPQGKSVRGRDEVGNFFQHLVSIWSDFKVDVDDFVADRDRVCVLGRATGKVGDTTTGYGFVHAWTMRDGVAVRFDEYVDPDPELLAR